MTLSDWGRSRRHDARTRTTRSQNVHHGVRADRRRRQDGYHTERPQIVSSHDEPDRCPPFVCLRQLIDAILETRDWLYIFVGTNSDTESSQGCSLHTVTFVEWQGCGCNSQCHVYS